MPIKGQEKAVYVSMETWKILSAISVETGETMKVVLGNLIATHPKTKDHLESMVKWAKEQTETKS